MKVEPFDKYYWASMALMTAGSAAYLKGFNGNKLVLLAACIPALVNAYSLPNVTLESRASRIGVLVSDAVMAFGGYLAVCKRTRWDTPILGLGLMSILTVGNFDAKSNAKKVSS